MGKTTIEWTEHTWNPTRGCSRISPGCQHCYAERQAARFNGFKECSSLTGDPDGQPQPFTGFVVINADGPHWTGRVELIPEMLKIPLCRRKPTTYFVNSMSDLFHESLPDEAIDQVFAVMALCPQHTFQVLTKRAKRMREYCSDAAGRVGDAIMSLRQSASMRPWHRSDRPVCPVPGLDPGAVWWPLPWVWLGVSAEDQPYFDERWPLLRDTLAEVRFISYEPALGPLDVAEALPSSRQDARKQGLLDWLIAGGESGPSARPPHPQWFRDVRDQCVAAGVPFFFKQWGEWFPTDVDLGNTVCVGSDGEIVEEGDHGYTESQVMRSVGKKAAGALLDGREWREMPEVCR